VSQRRPEPAARHRAAEGDARTRLLETAYTLFSRNGIRPVGIDRIIAEAGVAKMTLYRHFASKDDLALAFLDLHEQRWTRDWFAAEIEQRARTPRERLLAAFDALDMWFHEPAFVSCAFVRTLFEVTDRSNPVHQAAARHLDNVQALIAGYAREAGIARPDQVAYELYTLMTGAIVAATRGELDAASRVRDAAELILENAAPAG
jgi:AcrR family transcriptional regulator